MATTVISGRVDERVKSCADVFIRAAGLSTGDVIRSVWERIAQTGEVPDMGKDAGQLDASRDPLERLGELRASFGACEDLVELDDGADEGHDCKPLCATLTTAGYCSIRTFSSMRS